MNDIEYFYSAHSAFAYIGSAKLQEIAKRNNARLIHRPMDLRRVTSGMGGATNSLTPLRRAYFSRREIERWAEYRGVPIMCGIPTHHAKALELSNGVLIAAIREG
ncbi:MAG TPA: DsbA family protein, partial [Hyphomicrobiaceae bacterium]|nr:DsbA family protein [Hyphomicrobiaceae bacterium]